MANIVSNVLQKLNFSKLRLLHDIACKHDDAQMADFIGTTPFKYLLIDAARVRLHEYYKNIHRQECRALPPLLNPAL